jgi:O-antigen ligase
MTLEQVDRLFFRLFFFGILIVPLLFIWNMSRSYEVPRLVVYYIFSGLFLFLLVEKINLAGSIRVNKKALTIWIVFIIINLISALFAKSKVNAFFGERYIESVAFYVVSLFWLIAAMQISRENLIRIAQIIPYQAAFVSALALVQSLLKIATLDYQLLVLVRPGSVFGNPNFLGIYCAASIVITVHFFLESKKFRNRIVFALFLFLNIWGLVMAGSRAALIAGFIGFCFYLTLGIRRVAIEKRTFLTALCSILVLVVLFGAFAQLSRTDRAQETYSTSDPNIIGRLAVWKLALNAVRDNPLLGIGPDNFGVYYKSNRSGELVHQPGYYDQAHNWVLQIAVTSGLVGLGLFLWFLWLVLKRSLRYFLNPESGFEFAIALSIVSILIAALFGPLDISTWFLLISFCGFLLSTQDQQGLLLDDFKINSPITKSAFQIGGLVMIVAAVTFFVSHIFYGIGYRAYIGLKYDRALKFTSAAIVLNPLETRYHFYYNAAYAKRFRSVSSDIDTIVKLNPHDGTAYWRRSGIVLYVANKTKDKDLENKGLSDQNRAMELDQNYPRNFETRGEWLYSLGQYDSSEYFLKKALELDPSFDKSKMILASIYSYRGDKENMLKMFKLSLKQQPLNIPLKHYIDYLEHNPEASFKDYKVTYGVDISE